MTIQQKVILQLMAQGQFIQRQWIPKQARRRFVLVSPSKRAVHVRTLHALLAKHYVTSTGKLWEWQITERGRQALAR